MPIDIYLNVAVSGVLTGLVYGLMALGLSVIFGVVRVVNFAHGEMMTVAMYVAVVLFSSLGLDPLIMLVPIAAVMFAFGYVAAEGRDQRVRHAAGDHAIPADDRDRDRPRERPPHHLRAGRARNPDELRL